MFIPQHLTLWTTPDSWYGTRWDGWYPVVGRSRDSDALERSNFEVIEADLEKLAEGSETPEGDSTVVCVHEGHWAAGWVDTLMIHESDELTLMRADSWVAALADYPVADEEHFIEKEYEEAEKYWESMSVKDRLYEIGRCGADPKVSAFAARRDELPEGIYASDLIRP